MVAIASAPANGGVLNVPSTQGAGYSTGLKTTRSGAKTREKQIGLRSLGRDLTYGVFRSKITPEGVTVSRPEIPR
jgi:hypothetical protein